MIKFETLPKEILSRLPDVKKALAEDENVTFAYLFGSLASGRVTPLSDVDIAVYLGDVSKRAEHKLALFDKLTDALGSSELDLVILNTAPTSIAGRVLQNKQILVDKEPFRRHAYESLTLREFFDFRVKEEAFFQRRYGINAKGWTPRS
jgi:uncharacterized protein